MKCNDSKNCCLDCRLNCIGKSVCPVLNYTTPGPEKKTRMTNKKMFDKLFEKTLIDENESIFNNQ
jgi:hypothetical protein